uniref:Uncharacterized protein n=1 Tax=Schizaphis graminum TaxID=13262 RepID=A0A2S2NFY4_SCHGA
MFFDGRQRFRVQIGHLDAHRRRRIAGTAKRDEHGTVPGRGGHQISVHRAPRGRVFVAGPHAVDVAELGRIPRQPQFVVVLGTYGRETGGLHPLHGQDLVQHAVSGHRYRAEVTRKRRLRPGSCSGDAVVVRIIPSVHHRSVTTAVLVVAEQSARDQRAKPRDVAQRLTRRVPETVVRRDERLAVQEKLQIVLRVSEQCADGPPDPFAAAREHVQRTVPARPPDVAPAQLQVLVRAERALDPHSAGVARPVLLVHPSLFGFDLDTPDARHVRRWQRRVVRTHSHQASGPPETFVLPAGWPVRPHESVDFAQLVGGHAHRHGHVDVAAVGEKRTPHSVAKPQSHGQCFGRRSFTAAVIGLVFHHSNHCTVGGHRQNHVGVALALVTPHLVAQRQLLRRLHQSRRPHCRLDHNIFTSKQLLRLRLNLRTSNPSAMNV